MRLSSRFFVVVPTTAALPSMPQQVHRENLNEGRRGVLSRALQLVSQPVATAGSLPVGEVL